MTIKISQNLLAVGALIASMAAPPAYAQDAERGARGTGTQALASCIGFAQEFVSTNTQTTGTSTSSTGFVVMPNSVVNGGGSGGSIDLYTVTFSGQASATGGGSWEIQAQVNINGTGYVDMNPNEPNTFHSGNAAQTHTMTWCREFAASSAAFRILWRKVGGTFGGSAVIDDYLMRVERSN